MDKLKMHSPDLTQDNITKIRELFPGCVSEARDEATGAVRLAVDFDQLRQELSDHIVDASPERYRLDWPGKREALVTANAPIAKTLRPVRDDSVEFDTTQNLFIEGDNLEALKLLQETYLGKVKVIYIDPPYNTGNDFVYDDDFAESSYEYFIKSTQVDDGGNRLVANNESNGRFHSDWLSMMYSRLKVSKNLLASDGAIFISIDENEAENLKKICDEIFGENNFLGNICVVSNLKGRSDDKYFATAHNSLLAYGGMDFVTNGVPLPDDYLKDYPNVDADGRNFRLQGLRKRGSGARREDRPNMFFPIYVNPETKKVSLSRSSDFTEEVLPKLSDGSYGRWRWGKDTAKSRSEELIGVQVGTEKRWDVAQIDYADQDGATKRIKPKSVWLGPEFSNEAGTLEVKGLLGKGVFDTPKPTSLIDYILEQTIDSGGIVIDFFAGSGSTAHAVIDFSRKNGRRAQFILVQLPEATGEQTTAFKAGYSNIAEIAKERIRRAGKKILEGECHPEWNGDVGFRVLKVDTSNMKDVYYRPDELDQSSLLDMVDNVKEGRSSEDLLFQVLVDWGVDLTLPIRRETVQGKTVFFVDDNALVACFDQGVTEELVKELAGYEPLRVVFRDNGFASDAVKINVEQIFRQLSPTTDVKSI